MNKLNDGPVTDRFTPIFIKGNYAWADLASLPGLSPDLGKGEPSAPRGSCTAWGIPFEINDPVVISSLPVRIEVGSIQADWLVFLHTSDKRPQEASPGGFISPMRGEGILNERAADYVVVYEDSAEERVQVRRRYQLGAFQHRWGEMIFTGVLAQKPYPMEAGLVYPPMSWGETQTRAANPEQGQWVNWLWAWQNPHPQKKIAALRFEPGKGAVILSAISAGSASEQPLRWRSRRKAILRLPEGIIFEPKLDEAGRQSQIQLDMGQVISVRRRAVYPQDDWSKTPNNQTPQLSERELLVEYTSHPDANFHLWDGQVIPVAQVEKEAQDLPIQPVAPAVRRVTLKVIDQQTGNLVAVKFHAHGASGERLVPVDRHRIVNANWFEDYSVDYVNGWTHECTYIPGETVIDLPLGKVYLEISKGFEIRPVRKVVEVAGDTEEILIKVERVLPWRERGWVTADTHVHFLSPDSALLEGAAEGVNVVNLLASQWGELMTNVGDFDGRTTHGLSIAGGGPEGNGEYLVRVGTENRQHVLGHISLLGYRGRIIAPMTTGGPDESALGDPIEILLTEWARQCKKQGGLVVLPHYPNPRAEHAASIVSGDIDAVEMTSWGDLYSGISPYSLADWYRYLNCGIRLAAVAGTDKMSANTAVGAVRTYARLAPGEPFTYDAWMEAVRRAETFATYGPLLEFSVEGRSMGSRISLPRGGGKLRIDWQVASVTVPTSRVELIVNGEIREGAPVPPEGGQGGWDLRIDRSEWLALLVRGKYPDRPEMIAAHSSPVMVDVEGSRLLAAADAVTILEQIEGAMAYLDTVGTRAEDRAYKRMRLVLESARRGLHNQLHEIGSFHEHNLMTDHAEHH